MANIVLDRPRRPSLGRVLSVGFVVLVALGLLGLLLWGMYNSSKPSGAIAITPRPAPPFTVTLFDGSTVRLADLQGKVVVLNFWASWCVPCREEATTLQQMALRYQDQGVVFLGVNVWDKDADARAFLA
ncbi:MAG: TlpA family protein disulfide reductase, partial [Dehalococcoidia bacterium]|nr:TlpA family protein disulfide reductase [Dehalococcoidia bacterium]